MAEWKWQERMCALVEAEGRPDGIVLTVLSVGEDHIIGIDYDLHAYGKWAFADVKPHWDDPATLGCLLRRLREAYPHHHITTHQNEFADKSPGYGAATVAVYDPVASETIEHDGETLAEAAVKALEAAP